MPSPNDGRDSLIDMEGSMQRTAMRFAPVYARDFIIFQWFGNHSIQGVFNIADIEAIPVRELPGWQRRPTPPSR